MGDCFPTPQPPATHPLTFVVFVWESKGARANIVDASVNVCVNAYVGVGTNARVCLCVCANARVNNDVNAHGNVHVVAHVHVV